MDYLTTCNNNIRPLLRRYLHRSVTRMDNREKQPKKNLKKLASFCKCFLNLEGTATLKNPCYDNLCGFSCNSTILHTSLVGVELSAHSKVTSLFPTIPGLFYARNLFFTHKTATL